MVNSTHKLLMPKPFRKTIEGHPTVEGDSTVVYPHGPQAMKKPTPGMPAAIKQQQPLGSMQGGY